MLVRHLIDRNRLRWRVWAIRPAGVLNDRRSSDRRVRTVDEEPDPPVLERRTGHDRRMVQSFRGRGAHVLPNEWRGGWLVFEPDDDAPSVTARRLAPIPDDWDTCDDACMIEYLERATEAVRRSA